MCRCVGGSFGHCVVFEAEAWVVMDCAVLVTQAGTYAASW